MSAASVYRFDQLDEVEKELVGGWEAVRGLLGGKGANLAEMTRLGIPVPPGFTVTTQACLRYLADDNTMPAEVWEQVLGALRDVEQVLDKRFGDPTSPLLVSCRSGARCSAYARRRARRTGSARWSRPVSPCGSWARR